MPTIRIDDDVYQWLKDQAQPFEDTPNSVLRRVAQLDKPQIIGRRVMKRSITKHKAEDSKTPQYAFRDPIIKILKRFGGQGHRLDVLKELEKVMADQLTDFDKLDISSGTVRWQKSAEWEVRVMREQNILKPVSATPRGVWALVNS